ncbi:MAG TPA: 1,4-dihydroxy-2-naphthoate octaprenyltransferase [Burkholderiales bacterium]|nr:1,4-dihydroxy-2-naphthoate octaprenyltransferase [Burkholderiales bacterium]
MNEAALPSRRDIWIHMLLYPGHTLPTALAPVLVAVGLAVHDGVFAAGPALLALLAGWLVQLGGVLTDHHENLVWHPSDREHPQLVRALRQGSLTLFGLKAAIFACFGVALAIGAYLVHLAGVAVLVIGLASIAAAVLYSAGPSPLGSRGLADPLFFAFFGTVSVVGAYYVQAAPAAGPVEFWQFVPAAAPLKAFALSLPIGALTTCILIIDDIRDREFDAVKGKNTVAVRFGAQWSRAEFMALLAFACLAPLWLVAGLGYGAWLLLPLASLPYMASTARAVLTLDRFEALVPMTPQMARLLVLYATLLAFGAAQP